MSRTDKTYSTRLKNPKNPVFQHFIMKNDMIFQLFQQKQKNGSFSAKSSNFNNPDLCSSVRIPDKLLQIHDINKGNAIFRLFTSVFIYFRSIAMLTLHATGISKSCIKTKINLNFYFHTSLRSVKRFYGGL